MTKRFSSLKIANAVAFAAMVTVNILANTIPLGGYNTSQISAMYPTIMTPPGFTFIIWAVIYGLLGIFIISQFFFKNDDEMNMVTEKIGPFFIISCALNIIWLLLWHGRLMVPAFIIMVCLLISLIRIYTLTRKSNVFIRTAFGVYYAWITVASLISVFILVKTVTGNAPVTPIEPRFAGGLNAAISSGAYTDIILIAGDPEIGSYVSVFEYAMSVVAVTLLTLITIWHYNRFEDLSYVITIAWATGGIMLRQLTSVSITKPVLMLAAAGLGLALIAYTTVRKINRKACKQMAG